MCDACDLKGVLYKLTLKYCSRLLELTSIHTIHCLLIAFFFRPTSITIDFLWQNKSTHTQTYERFGSNQYCICCFYFIHFTHITCTVDAKCFLAYINIFLTSNFWANVHLTDVKAENSINLCFDSDKRSRLRV